MLTSDIIVFVLIPLSLSIHLKAGPTTSAKLSQRSLSTEPDVDDITCSLFYGHPDSENCHEVIEEIEDSVRKSGVDLYSKVEFIAMGSKSQRLAANSYHTPLYWKSTGGQ